MIDSQNRFSMENDWPQSPSFDSYHSPCNILTGKPFWITVFYFLQLWSPGRVCKKAFMADCILIVPVQIRRGLQVSLVCLLAHRPLFVPWRLRGVHTCPGVVLDCHRIFIVSVEISRCKEDLVCILPLSPSLGYSNWDSPRRTKKTRRVFFVTVSTSSWLFQWRSLEAYKEELWCIVCHRLLVAPMEIPDAYKEDLVCILCHSV